ncbi:MAG: ABC transporter ATP-binding protein/permease [Hyphomicrobiales bacterium]|nr:ABC transporter ATP-binding protein/permease [Hyphomicrobiales bacterium]MDE2114682.1 ABC transporter ATP-binding protein/permease [Hyphomicrobiales bacterium]
MTQQALERVQPSAKTNRHPKAEGSLAVTVRNLWPYIWPKDRHDLKLRVFLALALMIVSKFVNMGVPFSFKWATDALVNIAKPGTTHDLANVAAALSGPLVITLLYGLFRISTTLTQQARDALFAAVAMNAVRHLALDVFIHIHQLSLRFHLERKTGGLTRVLERGRAAIETIVRMVMLTAVPTIVEFVMILAVLLWKFNWYYALVVVLTIVAYMWFTTFASNWRIGIRRAMNESDTDANTKAIDSLLNYETVKYFGAEQREQSRYNVSMERFEKMSVRTYTSLAVLNFGQGLIFSVGLMIVMAMCVIDIRAGRNSVGDFVLINAMMIQLSQPLNFMGMVYREVKQAVVDIEMMFDILDKNPEIQDHANAPDIQVTEGRVRFEDVRFSYDPAREILRGVSFEVPAGKTVAIVGPSGAGKSTLSRLLFRFYEPQSGRITIDGQDIAAVTQTSLRRQIGIVPQDTVLFNDTIAYNIRYGRWDATREEIEEASRLAQIDKFIKLVPGGFDAQVGERGLKLSGGEKQRVAIARTILKAPPILVLDEATSALDTFTEREIQDALDRVSKGRTTLVIAHRLSTVVNADEIIVLDKGVIAERGTHDQLLAKNGIYFALWSRQRQVDEAQEALRRAAEAEEPSVRVTVTA